MYEWFLESVERLDETEMSIIIVLNEFKEYKIGRKRGYEIICPNPLVSRNHGIITFKPDGYIYIRDLQSSNGTFINDSRIVHSKDIMLQKNDLLGIGAPSNAQEPKKELFRVGRRLCKTLEESQKIVATEENKEPLSINLKLEVPQMENVLSSSNNVLQLPVTKEKSSLQNKDKLQKFYNINECIKNETESNLSKELINLSDTTKKNVIIESVVDKETNNFANINEITKDIVDENNSDSKNTHLDNRTTNESIKSVTEIKNKNEDSSVEKNKIIEKESKNTNIEKNMFLEICPINENIPELKVKTTSEINESLQSGIKKTKIDTDRIAKSSENIAFCNKFSTPREGCSEAPVLSNHSGILNNNDKDKKTSNEMPTNYSELQNDSFNTRTSPTKADIKLDRDYINELLEKRQKSKESYEEIIISSDEDNPVNVKSEQTNHSFTMNDYDDIVIVSDDDDDIFPRSQLFEMKQEPEESTSAAADLKDQQELPFNIKNEVPDYDDYNDHEEDALDDDDCRIWYIKLSQSQDFISSHKRKVEVISPVPQEENFFPSFDDRDLEIDLDKPKNLETFPVLRDAEENEEYFSADEDLEKNKTSVPVENKEKESKQTVDEVAGGISADKSTELPKGTSLDETDAEHSKNKEKKKWYVKPPVIEAPHLTKGKRKASEESKVKEIKTTTRKKKKSTLENASSSSTSLTTQGSSITIDKSVKTELDKRHKRRRKSTEVYSKDEKLKIQEDRKKKLKEIASKKSTKEKKKTVQKPLSKPKVKVSNSRGLFLTGEEEVKERSLKKKADAPLDQEPVAKKKYTIPKTSKSVNDKTTSKTICVTRINKLSFNDLNSMNTEIKESSKSKKYPERRISVANESSKIGFPENRPSTSNDNRNEILQRRISVDVKKSIGILLSPNANRVRHEKKKVRFNLEPQIKFIERSPGNNCRKVNSKDAPIPEINTNENEILSTVLCWKPAWLEEQKVISVSPQVSKRQPLRMLTNFNSVGDYINIVTPLMLLELWSNVFKDWCCNNIPIKLARIENIVKNPNGLLYLSCYCLAEKDEVNNYPKQGDLLIAEYYFDVNSKVATTKKFGYVSTSIKRRMTPTDHVHKQFSEFGPIAPFKVQFTLLISCNLNITILQEKLMRIRLVSRISPSLRLFKPVLCLNNSPLSNLILKPDIMQYKISRPTQMTSVIEDDLNADQMLCIYEAYQMCTRNEAGIYMIQGPPGTGKSFVIKNLVLQLISDTNKNPYFKPRILLCAPSNGAIDEITHTLLEMRSKLPKKNRFKMIRLGPPNSIVKPVVRSISIPELVSKHIHMQQNNNLKNNHHVNDEYNFWVKKENTIKNILMSLEARQQDCTAELQKLKNAQERIAFLTTNRNHYTHQDQRLQEKEAEMYYLENADIICTTLSSCVGSKLEEMVKENKIEFTCCIVDEATQSNEQESLIPLLLNINKFVLVGDPEQLPPTTISKEAKHLGHGKSLFSRLQSCFDHFIENPIRLLTQQYRMHPEICKFPSRTFYSGKLQPAKVIAQRNEDVLDPCRLFCLNCAMDYKESEYLNKTEADLVLLLTDIVVKKTKYNVGVITPYTKQRDYLIKKWRTMRVKDNKETEEDRHNSRVAINTVDGFQGQERDVIIISAVRYASNLFLNDTQRLNVALTRAKHACFVCAHVNLFKTQSIWQRLEIDAKSRNFFYSLTDKDVVDERYMSKLIFRR